MRYQVVRIHFFSLYLSASTFNQIATERWRLIVLFRSSRKASTRLTRSPLPVVQKRRDGVTPRRPPYPPYRPAPFIALLPPFWFASSHVHLVFEIASFTWKSTEAFHGKQKNPNKRYSAWLA